MHSENLEQQERDSEMIFKQITSGDFDSYEMAETAVCRLYVPDMTVSRSGISKALEMLRKHYTK